MHPWLLKPQGPTQLPPVTAWGPTQLPPVTVWPQVAIERTWRSCHSSLFCWKGKNGAHIALDRLHLLYPTKQHGGGRWGRYRDSIKRHIVPTAAQPEAEQALSYNLAQARASPSEHAMHPSPRTGPGCGVSPHNSSYPTCVRGNGAALTPLE